MKILNGQYFLCLADVIMEDEDESVAYIDGKVYHSDVDGCITDEFGDKMHGWREDDEDTEKYFKLVLDTNKTKTEALQILEKIENLKLELSKLLNEL